MLLSNEQIANELLLLICPAFEERDQESLKPGETSRLFLALFRILASTPRHAAAISAHQRCHRTMEALGAHAKGLTRIFEELVAG